MCSKVMQCNFLNRNVASKHLEMCIKVLQSKVLNRNVGIEKLSVSI